MAREKHVYSDGHEVAHLWAHQATDWARAGNISFNGADYISYSTTVARIVKGRDGLPLYLVADHRYSVSTSKHIGYAWQAIPSQQRGFKVPVGRGLYSRPTISNEFHICELWYERILSKVNEAMNARKPKNWRLILEALNDYSKLQRFIELADTGTFSLAPFPVSAGNLKDIRACYDRRQGAMARRTYSPRYKRQEFSEERRIKALKNYEVWKLGNDVNTDLFHQFPTALRIKGSEVETSLGARFPVEHAKRGLVLVKSVIARGEAWQANNGHTYHLGHYWIDSIDADGTVHAGCHHVPFDSIERIAAQLEVA